MATCCSQLELYTLLSKAARICEFELTHRSTEQLEHPIAVANRQCASLLWIQYPSPPLGHRSPGDWSARGLIAGCTQLVARIQRARCIHLKRGMLSVLIVLVRGKSFEHSKQLAGRCEV